MSTNANAANRKAFVVVDETSSREEPEDKVS